MLQQTDIMSKRAEEAALREYPPSYSEANRNAKRIQSYKVDTHKPTRQIYIKGYEQAEKDIWDRIEKYLKTRHHMDYATVGWILNNLEYYKQKIMEKE